MRLEIKNIGKLAEADIVLNGITVIAGENNTGKSTVSKALYSIFNSFYKVEEHIEYQRKNSIRRWLGRISSPVNRRPLMTNRLVERIIKNSEADHYDVNDIENDILSFIDSVNKESNRINDEEKNNISEIAEQIYQLINVSENQLFKTILGRAFELEFHGQICNMFTDEESYVKLTIKTNTVSASFKKNKIVEIEDMIYLVSQSTYIDDPFVLDNLNNYFYLNSKFPESPHRINLKQRIRKDKTELSLFDEILVNNKLEKIYNKINSICEGELYVESDYFAYAMPDVTEPIDINNVSTGLKTFVIIKSLLQNGEIGEKSTLILDEPEIHLHPDWQILFAEIIVLLQKEFDMTILINTHSPYFLEAIEVYSKKYDINSKCKYYLAENIDRIATLYDVTDNPEKIYKKLAEPFQKLENTRFSDE